MTSKHASMIDRESTYINSNSRSDLTKELLT